MQIEAFLLCETASTAHGSLSVLHAFDTIVSTQFPIDLPLTIALRIRFSRVEEGEHPVRILIIDEDGNRLGTLSGTVGVRVPEESSLSNLSFAGRVKIERPGIYAVDLAIDNRQIMSLPLYVKAPPEGIRGPEGESSN